MGLVFRWMVSVSAVLLLAGCGSEADKMERGVVVDREVAVPHSDEEMEMTEAERQAAQIEQEHEREKKRMEERQP